MYIGPISRGHTHYASIVTSVAACGTFLLGYYTIRHASTTMRLIGALHLSLLLLKGALLCVHILSVYVNNPLNYIICAHSFIESVLFFLWAILACEWIRKKKNKSFWVISTLFISFFITTVLFIPSFNVIYYYITVSLLITVASMLCSYPWTITYGQSLLAYNALHLYQEEHGQNDVLYCLQISCLLSAYICLTRHLIPSTSTSTSASATVVTSIQTTASAPMIEIKQL